MFSDADPDPQFFGSLESESGSAAMANHLPDSSFSAFYFLKVHLHHFQK
jgi:hypothetical protein